MDAISGEKKNLPELSSFLIFQQSLKPEGEKKPVWRKRTLRAESVIEYTVSVPVPQIQVTVTMRFGTLCGQN